MGISQSFNRSILEDEMVIFVFHVGKKLADGKSLSGAGRLTLARVDTMQNFYGRAIRDNKNDAKAMSRATHAILKHYSSTPEKPQHDDCPVGDSSWCSFQRDIVNGTELHKPIKDPLPDAVVEVVQPMFDQLGDESFLVGCEKCYTQNRIESLHHVIWGMASKETYTSPQEISLAVSLGVLHFNQGFQRTYTKLVPALDIDLKPEMSDTWEKIDADRVYQSDYRAASSTKTKRKKKRKQKLKKQDVFIHQEGVMYKSQGFHEVNKDKGKISKKGKKGNGQGKSNGNARQKQNAKNKGKGKQKK